MAQTIDRTGKDGVERWLVRVYMGDGPDGKRIYHYHTVVGGKRQAEKYERQLETARDNHSFTEPSKRTLKAYLEDWLTDTAARKISGRTLEDYRSLLTRYVFPVLGNVRLDRLQKMTMECQKLINDIADNVNEQNGQQTIRTAQYLHTVLKQALTEAVRLGMMAKNPMELTRRPRKEHKEMRPMSEDEARRFLEAAAFDRYAVLFTLMIETGMRPGEALGLRWDDIDLETGTLHVQRSLERTKDGWKLKEPKTSKSRRNIPISRETVKLLKQHESEQAEARLAAKEYENHHLVFTAETGNPVDRHNLVSRHFKPVLEHAGLPTTIRLYDLRHTCATLLMKAGEIRRSSRNALGMQASTSP